MHMAIESPLASLKITHHTFDTHAYQISFSSQNELFMKIHSYVIVIWKQNNF